MKANNYKTLITILDLNFDFSFNERYILEAVKIGPNSYLTTKSLKCVQDYLYGNYSMFTIICSRIDSLTSETITEHVNKKYLLGIE